MRNTTRSIVLAALLAMLVAPAGAATGLERWDYEPLIDDWRASAVLGGDVFTRNGREIGDVTDLIFNAQGYITTVIVRADRSVVESGDAYYPVRWGNVDFDPNARAITVDRTLSSIRDLPSRASAAAVTPTGDHRASRLIGLAAALDDRAPYGEVDDLLIDAGAGRLSALLIEPDGRDAAQIAVPAHMAWIDSDTATVELPFRLEVIDALAVFPLAE